MINFANCSQQHTSLSTKICASTKNCALRMFPRGRYLLKKRGKERTKKKFIVKKRRSDAEVYLYESKIAFRNHVGRWLSKSINVCLFTDFSFYGRYKVKHNIHFIKAPVADSSGDIHIIIARINLRWPKSRYLSNNVSRYETFPKNIMIQIRDPAITDANKNRYSFCKTDNIYIHIYAKASPEIEEATSSSTRSTIKIHSFELKFSYSI